MNGRRLRFLLAGLALMTMLSCKNVNEPTYPTYYSWVKAVDSAPFSPRHGSDIVIFNSKMWLFGGGSFSDIWNSPDGINWTMVTNSAADGNWRGASVCVHNGKLWIIGGGNVVMNSDEVWSSPDGVAWTLETNSPGWIGREDHTCVSFNGKLWLIGGDSWVIWDYLGDAWSSTDGVTWTEELSLGPFGQKTSHQCFVFKGKMWLVGGYSPTSVGSFWHTSDGVNWAQGTEPYQLGYSGIENGRWWFFMHKMAPEYGDREDAVYHSTSGNDWTKLNVWLPAQRDNAGAGCVFNNRLWLIGGSINYTYLNDIWYLDIPL